MFGVLVAQGEKAAASLEILISSISADMLAEVVMANMCNFPPKSSKSEGDEEPQTSMAAYPEMIGSATHISHLSALITDVLSQSRSSPEKETIIEDPHHAVANELEGLQQTPEEGAQVTLVDSNVAYDDLNNATITSEIGDIEGVENEIPGLSSSTQDTGLPEITAVSPRGSTEVDDVMEEKFTNLGVTPIELDMTPVESAQSLSTDRSEELSPKAAITDTNNMNSSTATSVVLVPQLILPKISAPVIHLGDDQKDQLQQLALVRIIDAYRHVTVAGGVPSPFFYSCPFRHGVPFGVRPMEVT